MKRTFTLNDPYDYDGCRLRDTVTFEFDAPVTVLVGCNGAGKTTLMAEMQRQLEHDGIPFEKHYALQSHDRLSFALTNVGDTESMQAFSATTWASEGERIKNGFAYLSSDLGHFIYVRCKAAEEAWVFMDSLDSGMSIDNVREVVDFLKDVMIAEKPEDLDLNVVIAANSYEFARAFDCLDVQTGEHLAFNDYDSYAEFVMASADRKTAYLNAGIVAPD